MAWGDIMVKYPEIVTKLPPGLIAVAWEYDPGSEEHYEDWLGPLVAHHIPHLIASGVTSRNQTAPDFLRSFENIDTSLAAGRESRALGIVNTIWTDDAQTLVHMPWLGMAYGAAANWQSTPIDRKDFFSAFASLDRTPTFLTRQALLPRWPLLSTKLPVPKPSCRRFWVVGECWPFGETLYSFNP